MQSKLGIDHWIIWRGDKVGCLNRKSYANFDTLPFFPSVRDSWNKERSEKDELLKNTKAQNLQQQARAQDAEVIFFSFSERHAENVEEKLVTSTLSPPKRPLAAVCWASEQALVFGFRLTFTFRTQQKKLWKPRLRELCWPFTPLHWYSYSPHCSLIIPLVLTRRICLTIRRFLKIGDHFLYSHDLYTWFKVETVRRNYKSVSLRG